MESNRTIRILEAAPAAKFGMLARRQAGTPRHGGWLGAPLIDREGRNCGALFVSGRLHGDFTPVDELLVEQLAGLVSLALENAILLDQLRASHEQHADLIGTVVHELRNPLAPIRFWLEVVRLDSSPGTVSRAREMIDRQVSRLACRLDDLDDSARMLRESRTLRRTTSLHVVVVEAIKALQPDLERHQKNLVVEFAADSIDLEADPALLTGALTRLIAFVADSHEVGGRVEIKVCESGDDCTVQIRGNDAQLGDEQHGSSDRQEAVRSQDAPSDDSMVRRDAELAFARHVVDLHGGTCALLDAGRGAAIELRLPRRGRTKVSRSDVRAASSADPSLGQTVYRILVVDDDRDSTECLASLLSMLGHDVRTAYDGLGAVHVAEQFAPQFVLLDIDLPGMSGYDVARRIREQPWADTTTLIAVTGRGHDEDRERSRAAGFHLHLVKPIDFGVLRAAIQSQ